MVTITLPPELEKVVTQQANQRGTTPELLAIDKLWGAFRPIPSEPEAGDGDTLADFLGDFIGCINSSEMVPGGAQMSVDTGKKFAAGMVKKRAEGRL